MHQVIELVGFASDSDSEALRGLLEADPLVRCVDGDSLDELQQHVEFHLPELILVRGQAFDPEPLMTFIQQLRESYRLSYRPVLIILAPESEIAQRIQYLTLGVDDVLESSMDLEELRARVYAHLRRTLGQMAHPVTQLPDLPLVCRALQRLIQYQHPWALLLVQMDQFRDYVEVYGELPAQQVLRTMVALMCTFVHPPDLLGQVDVDTFAVIVHPDRAEKLSGLLCRQFDTVVPNFYSEKDRKLGYLVSLMENQISRRVSFMTLSIGIANSQTQGYESYQYAVASAQEMKTLARMSPQSAWVSDRLKLTGTCQAQDSKREGEAHRQNKPVILVVETDAALAFLLKSTLELQGYEVDTASHGGEAQEILKARAQAQQPISIVLMDVLIHGGNLNGWELCRWMKTQFPHMVVMVLSSIHDRDKALSAGADMYMPKPFDLVTLFQWIAHWAGKPGFGVSAQV